MGAFQAGALLGLARAGILPDALYGCSAGALNAAFLAGQPDVARAEALATWWADPVSHRTLSPGWRSHVRGAPAMLRAGGKGLLDQRPLWRLIEANVRAHDLSELAVPLTVTTTCLDCGVARHHSTGPVREALVASCALPGLFAPVRLPDGHLHVDGGIVCGVPVQAALDDAGPHDRVLVLDCGLAPVTCDTTQDSCGLGTLREQAYVPPGDSGSGALDVILKAFTVARAVANRAAVAQALTDPRVQVVPHLGDAWAAGILATVPRGPRDFALAGELITAGEQVARRWLRSAPATRELPAP
jgi:predicted acylesterase/phospholipase RssA